jgi:hypothetical protein
MTKSFTAMENKINDKGTADKAGNKQYATSFLINTIEKYIKNSFSSIFQQIKQASGVKSKADRVNFTLKQKAKILSLAIKEYPHLNLRRAFWKWHFNSASG